MTTPREANDLTERAYANGTKLPNVWQVLIVILFALSGFIGKQVWDLSNFAAETRGNRFTAKDGLMVWQKIGQLEAAIPNQAPPQWLIDRLNRIEQNNKQLHDELMKHAHKRKNGNNSK